MPRKTTGRRLGKGVRTKDRDIQVLAAIHSWGGLLSLKQIDTLFFTGRGGSWPRERMQQLEKIDLVKRLRGDAARFVPTGEYVYVLTPQGAELVAAHQSVMVQELGWKAYKRPTMIPHDLRMNDFHLQVVLAVSSDPNLELHEWIPERIFRADPDKVTYTDPITNTQRQRGIMPDAFFAVRQTSSAHSGRAREYAYLVEMDMSTEHNPRFARDKVAPGLAYLADGLYEQRFRRQYGRWLVIVKSQERLENMLEHAGRVGGERVFFFTVFDQVTSETVFRAPIWRNGQQKEPFALIHDSGG